MYSWGMGLNYFTHAQGGGSFFVCVHKELYCFFSVADQIFPTPPPPPPPRIKQYPAYSFESF